MATNKQQMPTLFSRLREKQKLSQFHRTAGFASTHVQNWLFVSCWNGRSMLRCDTWLYSSNDKRIRRNCIIIKERWERRGGAFLTIQINIWKGKKTIIRKWFFRLSVEFLTGITTGNIIYRQDISCKLPEAWGHKGCLIRGVGFLRQITSQWNTGVLRHELKCELQETVNCTVSIASGAMTMARRSSSESAGTQEVNGLASGTMRQLIGHRSSWRCEVVTQPRGKKKKKILVLWGQ